jgi:uncharacterized membrane protein
MNYPRMFRIHRHFLISLAAVSIVTLLWDEVIEKEHITKIHKEASHIETNSVRKGGGTLNSN